MKDFEELFDTFISDFSVKGMIHALVIRSPVSSGTLKEIKLPKLPAFYRLITAAEIPCQNALADFPVPVLADKTLFYIGQPVAILTGPDKSELEELSSKIIVKTEALTDGDDKRPEIMAERDISYGENSDSLAAETQPEQNENESETEIEKKVSGSYETGLQEHWYSEPHGAVVIPSPVFTIHTATQWPSHVKRSVAKVLGIEKVKVKPTRLSLHLDGKIWYPSLVACHAALAAWVSAVPVKLMLTKEEDFLFSPKRFSSKIKMSSELSETGEIKNNQICVNLNLGAEGVFENELIDQCCLGTLGLYNYKAFRIKASALRSNIPIQGPMAGFGLSQGFFAAERHVSRIADFLGLDPAEWRKQNFISNKHGLAIGSALKDPMPLVKLIDAAAAESDYYRKWASYELQKNRWRDEKWVFRREPLRGIGISIAFQGNGFLENESFGANNCTMELTLEKDGFLEIRSSLGSCCPDTWQFLAQEILGVEPSMLRFRTDPYEVPDSGASTLSRSVDPLTRLMERCCTEIRKLRFRDPLPITVKRSVRPAKMPGWVSDKNIDTDTFVHPGLAAAVVELEIDPVSFEADIRGIWLIADGGKIINERRAKRILKTGIIQALGWASREELHYEDGKIPLELYRSYDTFSAVEIPPIHVGFFQNNPVNPKGIGELPFSCIPAAYVQAVSQAMDHHFEKIPLNAREIWTAWKQKQKEGS